MRAPQWLDDTVRSFGRQFRLEGLTLGERGVAGVRFADGGEFKLEYSQGRLALMATRPVAEGAAAAKAVLAAAAHDPRRPYRLRSGIFEGTGRLVVAVRIPEREVTGDLLARVFQEVWAAAAAAARRSA